VTTVNTLSSYRWVVFCVWSISSVSFNMLLYSLGVLLPSISADLNLSPSQQGLLGSASLWGNIALAIPLSWAASRLSPKWTTAATISLGTACLFLQSWAPGFAVLLLGRLLFGIGQIAQQPTRALLTRQWFPPHEVVIANGLGNVFFGLVVGGGLALSPLILEAVGGEWRTTLRIFGIYFAVLALIWVVLGKERNTVEYKQARDSGDVSTVRGALRYRDLWVCGIGFAGASMSLGGFMAFYPTFMLEEFDLSIRLSGSILAVGVIVGGISGLWLGYAAASASRERLYLEVLGTLMVGSFMGMVLTGSAPLLWVLTFFNGIAWGFFPILLTVPFNLRGIRPQELAVAYGFTIMFVSFGASMGPLFVGLLQDATDDLRLALLLVSLASVSLVGAGMKIRFGNRLSAV